MSKKTMTKLEENKTDKITIGCPSGYWGDAPGAIGQLLAEPGIHYLVFDYLAEITMSILARARAEDPDLGYATDFVRTVIAPHLETISERGVKLISNAGGLNPRACAKAISDLAASAGVTLRVAAVVGDDLMDRCTEFSESAVKEMFSGENFPEIEKVTSVNAYLGAFQIARALEAGADIVVTGRCVDSAVTLAACIHAFGWSAEDYDRLAAGSLAGHILECGPHATGGNFTDWHDVPRLDDIGYPIAIIESSGAFVCTKPAGTGGVVNVGTIAEQIVYEIGDPQRYLLPDVACDFSNVVVRQAGTDCVRVSGACGRAPGSDYKVCATYQDGFRGGAILGFYGQDAEAAARAYAENVLARTGSALESIGEPGLTATSIELLGAESHYGAYRESPPAREVGLKIAAKHPTKAGAARFLRELSGFGLATPPGLTGFAATRPKPSPVVRLFSFLLPKDAVKITVELDDAPLDNVPNTNQEAAEEVVTPEAPATPALRDSEDVALRLLAWGRSGDKGDSANIGIIARKPEYLPYIWHALSVDVVRDRFTHFITGDVERFLMPGLPAINFLLHGVLGGGGTASLRMDPQGKGFAQLLLGAHIAVPSELARGL